MILGGKPSSKGMGPLEKEPTEASPDAEVTEGGEAKEYARLAAEALVDGDVEGATEALLSLHHCK